MSESTDFPVGSKVRFGGQRGGVVTALDNLHRRIDWPTYKSRILARNLRPDEPYPRDPPRRNKQPTPMEIPDYLIPDFAKRPR